MQNKRKHLESLLWSLVYAFVFIISKMKGFSCQFKCTVVMMSPKLDFGKILFVVKYAWSIGFWINITSMNNGSTVCIFPPVSLVLMRWQFICLKISIPLISKNFQWNLWFCYNHQDIITISVTLSAKFWDPKPCIKFCLRLLYIIYHVFSVKV
jgi:hypothetical protein